MTALGTFLQLLALVVACVGAFIIDVGLGIIAVGVALFVLGLALERGE